MNIDYNELLKSEYAETYAFGSKLTKDSKM